MVCELLSERLQVGNHRLLWATAEVSRSRDVYAAEAVPLTGEHHIVALRKCTDLIWNASKARTQLGRGGGPISWSMAICFACHSPDHQQPSVATPSTRISAERTLLRHKMFMTVAGPLVLQDRLLVDIGFVETKWFRAGQHELNHLVGDVEVEVRRMRPCHYSDGKRLPALCAPNVGTAKVDAEHVGGALALQQPAQGSSLSSATECCFPLHRDGRQFVLRLREHTCVSAGAMSSSCTCYDVQIIRISVVVSTAGAVMRFFVGWRAGAGPLARDHLLTRARRWSSASLYFCTAATSAPGSNRSRKAHSSGLGAQPARLTAHLRRAEALGSMRGP